jgi:hypothetical protein
MVHQVTPTHMRIIFLAFIAISALAQTPTCTTAAVPVCQIGVTTQDVQIKPMAVPTGSPVKVAVVDAYLKGCTVNQPAGVTVTITDNQASPVTIIGPATFTVATQTIFVWGANPTQPGQGMFTYGYWAPGGFSMVASGSGATIQCAWRQ